MNKLLEKYYNKVMSEGQTELSYPLAIEYMRTCECPLTSFRMIVNTMTSEPTQTLKVIDKELKAARKWRDARPTALNSTVPFTLMRVKTLIQKDLELIIIQYAKNDGYSLEDLK